MRMNDLRADNLCVDKTSTAIHDGVAVSPVVRAGVVGAGLMGRWHASVIRRAGGRLVGVVDVDARASQRLAARHHGAQSFTALDRMLSEVGLDVLHICTPPSTHDDLARQAINAGINTLVEKPLTPHAAETEQLLNLAAERRVRMCPIHQFLFQDGFLKAKKLLPRIGDVLHIAGTFCSAGGEGEPRQRLDSIVNDILPHPLSLMEALLPGCISGAQWMTVRPDSGEMRAFGEAAGLTLSIFISMNARPTVCSLQIIGTGGTIHLDLFHGYAFCEPGRVSRLMKVWRPFDLAFRRVSAASVNLGTRLARREMAYPGLCRLVRTFYAATRTGGDAPISASATLAVARVRDALMNKSGGYPKHG